MGGARRVSPGGGGGTRGTVPARRDIRRFVEVVSAALAGQRYMTDLTAPDVDVRGRFEMCLEVPLEAMASQEWLDRCGATAGRTLEQRRNSGLDLPICES